MTVPLVAEFSACTPAYGRLAPLPPVAAAHAGAAARARTPPAASNAALLAKATTRLRFRMVLNTFAPFEAECRTFTGSAASQVDGGARTQGVTAVQGAGDRVRGNVTSVTSVCNIRTYLWEILTSGRKTHSVLPRAVWAPPAAEP